MLKERKEEVITALEHEISAASSMIVTDYRGLGVQQLAAIRNELRPLEATLLVTKNTLARIAAKRAGSEGLLELRGGIIDGISIDAEGVKVLATLPPREQLHAQLVVALASPISGLAGTLAAIPRSLVIALDQIEKQKAAA